MDFNAGIIIASSNVHTKSPLEPSGDKQTQVDVIQSWTQVIFVRPTTSLHNKAQHPIQMDTYIISVAK